MRNKKIARFMPAVLVAAVMMFILIPMGLVSAKAAPTGSGTEADPLVVDNFADLKAALESDKDAYIVVNEFANTEGKDYYELQSEIDYDQSGDIVIKISPNVEKHLEVNCTIDCREDCTGQDFALLEYFVYNEGTLFISGDGTIAANLHGDDYGELILIRNDKGKLVVDGNVTISAISSEGEKQISDYATPILSFEGILDIKNGTFVGCMDAPTGSINAVASVYDATLTISGGNFKCVTSNVNTSKCSINIHFPFVASINGGTFDGIAVTGKNISLKDLLDEGCLYAYSVNNNGQIVQGIDNRDGETQIEGTVRVGIPVTAADITITEPVVGAAPVFTGSAGTGDAGYKVSVEWLIGNDKTKKLSATDKFEGRDYVALVKLTAEDGYILDEASLKQNLKLNGVAKTNFNCGYAGAGGSLVVPFQLRYSEVSVTITEPVAGQSPDYTAVVTDAGYSAKITQWTEYQDDTQTDKVMSATDKFAEGKEYSAIIEISANEGYAFDVTKCTINGAEVALYDSNTVNVLYYRVVYDVDENYNGDFYFSITKPKAGANPDYNVVDIDNRSEYNVEIVSWYKGDNENDVLSSNDTFEKGETYNAKIKITANEHFSFNNSSYYFFVYGANSSTLISINSKEIYYKVTFIVKQIENITLQITEPVIGEEPDFTITTNDVGYTADLNWYCSNDKAYLKAGDKFEKGKIYTAQIELNTINDYVFDMYEGEISGEVLVNGEKTDSCDATQDWVAIKMYYPLITISEILDDVSITYTEPVIGAYPDYTVTTGDTKYTAEMMWYILVHSNNGPSGYMTLDPSQKFEAGETYRAEFLVTGSEDYGFDASITKLTVNGNLIDPNSVYLYLNTMAFMGSGITAKEAVTIQDITITTAPTKITYTEGETFDQTGMVVTATYSDNSTATVTGYTVSPSTALTTADTTITISYTEDGVTKTATQAITVNAKSNTENNNTENNNTENNNTENNNTGSNSGSTNSGSETGNNSGSTNTDNTNTGSNTGNYYNNTDTNNTNTGSGSGTNSGSINTGNTNTDNTNTGSNTGTNSGSTNNGNVNTGSNNGSNSGNTNSGSIDTGSNIGTTGTDTGNTAKDPKPTEIPDPVVTEVENKDGSKTKTTKEWSKDGTVTESKVTEYKNGDKSTSETVKDSTGKTVSTYTYSLTTTQKGNTVESIVDKKADGTLFKSTVTRYVTGKITVDTTAKNKDDLKKIINTKITYDTVKNGQVKVTAVKTNNTAITIPGTISVGEDSYTVYAIGKNAFKGNKTLETIIIEENINTVGANAFKGVKTLKNIYIYSKKLKTVGKNAFYGINENAKFYIKASKSNCKKFANKIKKAGFVGDISYKRITKKVKLS